MKFIYIIFISLFSLSLMGQDSHFSQFDALPMMLNPGQTGMYRDASYKAGTQYRNQWGSIGTKFSTSSIAYDMPVNDRWGVGGYILNDDASKAFNVFKVVIGGAYEITKENNQHLLTVGLHAGIMYKSLNVDKLTFDDQWSENNFDPDKPTSEQINNDYRVMPEVNLGVYYEMIDRNKKFKPYAGLAFFHVTHPNESFMDDADEKLPLRHQFNTGAKYKLNDQFTFDPGVFVQYQRNILEVNAGLRTYYSINRDVVINVGGYYRLDDAAIVLAGIRYKQIDFCMNYDITTSKLKQFTHGKGAFEFSIIYNGGLQSKTTKL